MNMNKTPCKVAGCSRLARSKWLCSPHYKLLLRNGTPISKRVPRGTPCHESDCKAKHWARGYCQKHYYKHYRTDRHCSVDGCTKTYYARGFCVTHNTHKRKHGSPIGGKFKAPRRKAQYVRDGYIYLPGFKGHANADKGGLIAQHRLVMADRLGRPLLRTENVHHKNGNRADNRIENLELWTTNQPQGQRVVDLLKYARELLALYANTNL